MTERTKQLSRYEFETYPDMQRLFMTRLFTPGDINAILDNYVTGDRRNTDVGNMVGAIREHLTADFVQPITNEGQLSPIMVARLKTDMVLQNPGSIKTIWEKLHDTPALIEKLRSVTANTGGDMALEATTVTDVVTKFLLARPSSPRQ